MATKAELEARIAELERTKGESLAMLDAITAATNTRGVRVVGEWDDKAWSILVAAHDVPPDDVTRIVGIFCHAVGLGRYIVVAGAEQLRVERENADDDA